MTYQKPSQHYDDNADANESSSLFLTVADASPPSSAFGHDGEATTKKNGVPVRAMIATTCFVLGTLAVLYYGGSSNTHRTDGTSEALLLGQNQAAPALYGENKDYCFADNDNPGKYCWYPTDNFPVGNWAGVGGHGDDNCGPQCTDVVAKPTHNSYVPPGF